MGYLVRQGIPIADMHCMPGSTDTGRSPLLGPDIPNLSAAP